MTDLLSKEKLTWAYEEARELESETPISNSTSPLVRRRIGKLEKFISGMCAEMYAIGAFPSPSEAKLFLGDPLRWNSMNNEGGEWFPLPHVANYLELSPADTILDLAKRRRFWFCYPIAINRRAPITTEFESETVTARLVPGFSDLSPRPGIEIEPPTHTYVFLEGSILSYRPAVESDLYQLVEQVQGCLLALDLVLPTFTLHEIPQGWSGTPPPRLIGFADESVEGEFDWVETVTGRGHHRLVTLAANLDADTALFVRGITDGPASTSEIGRTVDSDLRLLSKAFSLQSLESDRLRIAFGLFGRFVEAAAHGQEGEAALFLAVTLEALLLDGKNKEDLSSRLQEACAYYVAENPKERPTIRKLVKEIYEARSMFVHSGKKASLEGEHRIVANRVIRKEITNLT